MTAYTSLGPDSSSDADNFELEADSACDSVTPRDIVAPRDLVRGVLSRHRYATCAVIFLGSVFLIAVVTSIGIASRLREGPEVSMQDLAEDFLTQAGEDGATIGKDELLILNAIKKKAEASSMPFNILAHHGLSKAVRYLQMESGGDTAHFRKVSSEVHDSLVVNTPNQFKFCRQKEKCWLQRQGAAFEVGGIKSWLFRAQMNRRAEIWYQQSQCRCDGPPCSINPADTNDPRIYKDGPFLQPWFSWIDVLNNYAVFLMLPLFLLTGPGKSNRTTFFMNAAKFNCWEPAPLGLGPMSFTWADVYPKLSDPSQARGFFTATSPQSEKFFSKEALIFLSGEKHRIWRTMLEEAQFGYAYEIDYDLVKAIPQGSEVESPWTLHLPALMKALWGAPMDASASAATIKYITAPASPTIFGSVVDDYLYGPLGKSKKVYDARMAFDTWSKTTPMFKKVLALRDAKYTAYSFLSDDQTMAEAMNDISLFAGGLGVADLVHRCVSSQKAMEHHKDLFAVDPEKYLIEMMRFDSAVTSVTETLREESQLFTLEEKQIKLSKGTPHQLVIATANRDGKHWIEPNTFNPFRPDLGDTLSWNGRVKDVEARNFSAAPRFCPGYCLSVKLGSAICAQIMGSFETLLNQGKIGGPIVCKNFA